jgi:hypothetical protein
METLTVKIEGASPLLMHNGQLADPLNEHARALSDAVKTAKKSKTDAAWEAAYKIEFFGSLYLDDKLEPCLPGEVLEALIVEGAKKTKQGKEVKAGVIVDGNFALDYAGPRTADKLWKARMFKTATVKIRQDRVVRTRPMFTQWGCTFNVQFNPELVNRKDLIKFIEKAGAEVGVGDYRPRYGRFVVVAS